MSVFEPRDLEQLAARGLSLNEAERQIRLLSGPAPHTRLSRACRLGDGIQRLDKESDALRIALCRDAAAQGRLRVFVPASGAASRMFEALIASLAEGAAITALRQRAGAGDDDAAATLRFVRRWQELALAAELSAALASRGLEPGSFERDCSKLLAALLASDGLNYGERPKALIPFHNSQYGACTALEEHLVEAAAYVTDANRRCRLHFTISPEHLPAVQERLREAQAALERRLGVSFEITFSHQEGATDTLAVDVANRPLRHHDGSLLLRPGGHGALLRNLRALAQAGADVVFIKNIDNVVPERSRDVTVRWQQILGGHLLRLQAQLFLHLERLEAAEVHREDIAAALAFAEQELGFRPTSSVRAAPLEERRRFLLARLDRPLRVCAVVRNEGQPGGGPFWVEDARGEDRPQIVESAQVDHDSESQAEIWASSTHFNPVDIVCALRDRRQHPYELARYSDPDAVLVTAKSSAGKRLKALEHPGLWNGAMAHWNTVFVEAPAATFAPVKTVLDLLRPDHRA